ncbi:hypothetical protein OPQ81_011268 [Rhizoctonia solani]|nr:hypothetical protein OPQ81_011268 [Rhizoctonia solani]
MNNGTQYSGDRGAITQVAQASGQEVIQPDFLNRQASQVQALRPQAPVNILERTRCPQTPIIHPHSPLGPPHTPPNRFLTESKPPEELLNRPPIPQSQVWLGKPRPPNIFVPPPGQICGGLIAYNPMEPSGDLDSSPIPHGRRNLPTHTSSDPDILLRQPRYAIASRGPVAQGSRNQSRDTSYMTVPKCERALLIIGNSHREPTPYTTKLPPLLGIQNDRDRLRKAFQSRKYSVETMVEEDGDKREILRRVGNFLASAEEGDVRVIVFTGHAVRIGTNRQFAIIPSSASCDNDTISPVEWQNAVLNNAADGVVVISIFTTCMSGAMVEQSVELTNFDRVTERQSLVTDSPNGPIQIILSSSGDTQASFEYHTRSNNASSSWHDCFLWALAETTQRTDIDNWESFVKTLQTTFTYVRATSFRYSSFNYPHDLEWLLYNPQTPRIFVSSQMPDFDKFLPRQTH